MREQQLANSVLSQSRNGISFIPSCNSAGGYERMQCDRSVGECWCVNKMGDELPGTRIRGIKQYCDAPGRHHLFYCSFSTILNHQLKFDNLQLSPLSKLGLCHGCNGFKFPCQYISQPD